MKKLDITVTMADGTEYRTESRTSDYVHYEVEAKRRGWGSIQDNPSTWESYVGYRALVRDRVISMPFDKFLEAVDLVDAVPARIFPQSVPEGTGDDGDGDLTDEQIAEVTDLAMGKARSAG